MDRPPFSWLNPIAVLLAVANFFILLYVSFSTFCDNFTELSTTLSILHSFRTLISPGTAGKRGDERNNRIRGFGPGGPPPPPASGGG